MLQDYHDLLTRWFQFGAFTPLFRVHGGGTNTELWNFGPTVQANIVASAINVRYRMLPYIYSGFWQVQTSGYTMQRGLAFDFAGDKVSGCGSGLVLLAQVASVHTGPVPISARYHAR